MERHIPIYLVVGGAFAYFRMALSLCRRVQESMEDQKEEEEEDSLCYHRDNILDLFQFAWFIAGKDSLNGARRDFLNDTYKGFWSGVVMFSSNDN